MRNLQRARDCLGRDKFDGHFFRRNTLLMHDEMRRAITLVAYVAVGRADATPVMVRLRTNLNQKR